MEIRASKISDVSLVEINGKLTIEAGADELIQGIRELVRNGERKVVLDLGGVSYIDSTGVGSLLSCHTTVCRGDGRLRLLNLTPKTYQVLEIVKLLPIFEIYEDRQKALAEF